MHDWNVSISFFLSFQFVSFFLIQSLYWVKGLYILKCSVVTMFCFLLCCCCSCRCIVLVCLTCAHIKSGPRFETWRQHRSHRSTCWRHSCNYRSWSGGWRSWRHCWFCCDGDNFNPTPKTVVLWSWRGTEMFACVKLGTGTPFWEPSRLSSYPLFAPSFFSFRLSFLALFARSILPSWNPRTHSNQPTTNSTNLPTPFCMHLGTTASRRRRSAAVWGARRRESHEGGRSEKVCMGVRCAERVCG